MRFVLVSAAVFGFVVLTGCEGTAVDAFRLPPNSLQDRQLQTRVFDTTDEEKMLSACAGVIQDLGFNLDESETKLGLIVASKDRSAADAGGVTVAILLTALSGVPVGYDNNQKIKVSIISSPYGDAKDKVSVRVTFQRIVWDSNNIVTHLEQLKDPKMYEGFFEKLSKSAFLEAHSL